MNYLIQRGKVRGQVINVPEGLPELLSDITREVLRCQPTKECLCQFIIDYLHAIIVTREKALVAKSVIDQALRTVDKIISDLCICDITKAKADEMALIVEECFRKFLEKRRCEQRKDKEIIKFHEEDLLDEIFKRCKFTQHDIKISRPLIEEAYNRFVQAYMSAEEKTDGTEALYIYFKERERKREEELMRKKAAVKIQSNFRGFLVRRSMLSDDMKKSMEIDEEETDEDDIFNVSAIKIQTYYRQHKKSPTRITLVSKKPKDPDICESTSQISMTAKGPEFRPQGKAESIASVESMSRNIPTQDLQPAESEMGALPVSKEATPVSNEPEVNQAPAAETVNDLNLSTEAPAEDLAVEPALPSEEPSIEKDDFADNNTTNMETEAVAEIEAVEKPAPIALPADEDAKEQPEE